MKRLILCVATALTLTGCGSLANYTGPALKFSVGWKGIDAGFTFYGKKADALPDAGQTFDALLPVGGSTGKTPVPVAP